MPCIAPQELDNILYFNEKQGYSAHSPGVVLVDRSHPGRQEAGKLVQLVFLDAYGVPREAMVEIGNLATVGVGRICWIIVALAVFLQGAGFSQVPFTIMPLLRNSFVRMGLPLCCRQVLARICCNCSRVNCSSTSGNSSRSSRRV